MKAIWSVTLLVILFVSFAFAAQVYAQHEAHSEQSEHSMEADKEKEGGADHSMHDMDSDKPKISSDKARCAIEGMMMKKSAMVPMEHGDETLYFCSEGQKAMFQKSPKRYLKKVKMHGHAILLMNVLTTKEYMDMMGRMAKKGGPNDTHWLSVYPAEEHQMELSGVAVKVVSPDGKAKLQELKYDKMLKTYTGYVSLLETGKYKLSLLLESEAVVMP